MRTLLFVLSIVAPAVFTVGGAVWFLTGAEGGLIVACVGLFAWVVITDESGENA